jgi:putative flippase GtrA
MTSSTTFRQIRSFATIGVVSTLAYVVLYAALRGAMSATLANMVALVITAVGNTTANRRLTFGVRGRDGLGRHHFAGIVAFVIALTITSASIGLMQAFVPRPGRPLEIGVLVAANVLATAVRFVVRRARIEQVAPASSVRSPAAAASADEGLAR